MTRSLVCSPMDITEILQTVATVLDQPTLVAASLVSRHWNECCKPILWSTITREDWSLTRFSPRQLYLNAQLVRSLEWVAAQTYLKQVTTGAPGYMGGMMAMTIDTGMGMVIPAPPSVPLLPPQSSQHPSPKSTEPSSSTCKTSAECNPGVRFDHESSYAEVPGSQLEEPSVQEELSFNKILGRCANLQNLYLHAEEDGIHVDTVEAIRSLRFLQSLELYARRVVVAAAECQHQAGQLVNVQDLVEGLPQLKRLTLRGPAFSFQSHPPIEASCAAPSVIQSSRGHENNANFDWSPKLGLEPGPSRSQPSSATSFYSIQHLSLDTEFSEPELAFLLQQCPSLESLDLPGGLSWEWSDDFLHRVAEFCPGLSAFSVNSFCHPPVPEDRLTALVNILSPLRRFCARSCLFGDSTLNALEDRSPDLEWLDISLTKSNRYHNQQQGLHRLTKTGLYGYLRHAQGLKHLEAEGVWIALQDLQDSQDRLAVHGPVGAHDPQLPAQSEVSCDEQWASHDTLRHFTLGFTSPDRSTSQCHAMYALLSTLTHLEHLKLSYTCLDLSRDSGFRKLEMLTELRTFSIETCGYAELTKEDLVWMVMAWPKLECINVSTLGRSKEQDFRAWLKGAQREDVAIKSPQTMLF